MNRIVVVASRVPFPLDKGDKLRIYHQVKELSKHFEVCLCVLAEFDVDVKTKQALEAIAVKVVVVKLNRIIIYWNLFLALFSSKPFQVHYFYQRKAQRIIKQTIDEFKPIHIFCQLIRCAEYVKNIHTIPKTIDYMDAFSKGIERRIEKSGWKKALFKNEYKRLLKYENLIFDYFDFHSIISEQDRQFIIHPNNKEIQIVPNGIDTDFFKPIIVEKRYDLVFVGNMNYPPNVDAMIYFTSSIYPKLQKQHPNITLLIAGANPSREILALKSPTITVSGWVEDIRMSYASSKIFIAPLRIGTGLQNKLLEAMAMAIPCITSNLANKALEAQTNSELIACEDSEAYCAAVGLLLNDTVFANQMALNGREMVSKNFCWETSVASYIQKINSLNRLKK